MYLQIYNMLNIVETSYSGGLQKGFPQILGWSILDHQSRNGFRLVMYYPSSDMYPEMGMGEDVLDLCMRKEEKDSKEKYAGLNGYADNSGEYYGCKSPEMMIQQHRFPRVYVKPDQDLKPMVRQEKIYPEERIPPPGSSASPTDGRSFEGVGSRFAPLPTTISTITTRNGKPTRPFKAYPKEFLPLATSEGLLDDSNKRYMEFRRQFLTQLHATTALSNKNMKRPVQSDSPNQLPSSSGDAKDQAYWERRRKNNEAAKKSRDARRAKEDEIAIRAAFLERENVQLKLELASLRNETDRLRCMLYTS